MPKIDLDRVSLTFRVRQQQGRMTLKEYLVRGLFLRPAAAHGSARPARRDPESDCRRSSRRHRPQRRRQKHAPEAAGRHLLSDQRHAAASRARCQSLFDISLGFEPEATGWENIYYRSYLQGETRRSVSAKVDSIAAFSELGDFLNMPVRYYSAGMMVRLAFSIATAVEPEVLLIDEVLSVGDMAFQDKARKRMREMMSAAKLAVIVSHDLNSLGQLCDRGIWLDHGRIRGEGDDR